MRLAVNLRQFVQGEIGGLENYVRHVVGALASDRRFERVTIFAPHEQIANVQAFASRATLIGLQHDTALTVIGQELCTGYDLLFCPLLVVEPLLAPVRSAVLIPDIQHEFHPEFFDPSVLAWRQFHYKPSALEAAVVFTLSEHAKTTMVDRLGLDGSRIRVVHLDAGEEFRSAPDSAARAGFSQLQLPPEYVYCPANYWPHKNHANLLEAFARIAKRRPGLALVLSGAPASGQGRVELAARQLGLGHRVRFLGYQPHALLPEIYRHSRALVFASLFEGFGIPILEAFHTGVPVITSRTTSCPEVAGDAAVLVDPRDPADIATAIEKVLDDSPLRQRLAERGAERSRLFSWKLAIEKTACALLEAASAPLRSARVSVSENPVVSVVTPSFNMARFLDETIQSVLSQDYPRIEYIVMDGGSTDGTLEILRRYQSRLRFVSAPDGGQSDAINRGFEKTHGEIFAFLNADDTYLPGAVGTAVRHFLDHPAAGVVYGEGYHVNEDGSAAGVYPTRDFDYETLNRTCYICQPAAFMRREAFERAGRMDPRVHWAPDYELWLRIGKMYPMLRVTEHLANSRMHRDNKTLGSRRKVYREILRINKDYFGYVPWDWIYGYACFLADGKDQFFERPLASNAKFALAVLLGCYHNRPRLRRFLGEVARETGLLIFTGRWPDGWISRTYETDCRIAEDCGKIVLRGANDLIMEPLTLDVSANGRPLHRARIRQTGPFVIDVPCPPELRGTSANLTISTDRHVRPFWLLDVRPLSCRIESIDCVPAEKTKCGGRW